MTQPPDPTEAAKFYEQLGHGGVRRAHQVFGELRRALGDAEAERIDRTLSKPEEFLRLEALLYHRDKPSAAEVRAAMRGDWLPATLPPVQQIRGAPVTIKTAPLPSFEKPAVPAGVTGRAADPAYRTQREGELKTAMKDPRYWRDRDPAFIQSVEAGFKELYPGTSKSGSGERI
ncbi:hypothetical protein [Elioraea sp.]|uniref:hypothetical protein n=1 Tax=Elioraea sp. TaxID=2185103 RepID=UPI0025BC697F|nr:hypothetical protein [Elioraea sp.]